MSDPNLIPLQTAYITQARDVETNTWFVYDTVGNLLGKLSNKLEDKEAMSVIHFARKIELDALNIGIRFGEKQEHAKAEKIFQEMRAEIIQLQEQNVGLSNHLEQFIIGEGET